MLERNSNNLFIIENEVKQIIHAMDMNDSDYVMTFTTAIPSISINLNKLWIKSGFHSSYIKTIYNGEQESINNIFSTYVETLLDYINHPTLVQEFIINFDAAVYEKI